MCSPIPLGESVYYTPTITKILEGPKSKWLAETIQLLDKINERFFSGYHCFANHHDRIGFINEIYEWPEYGAGVHRVLSTNGDYPDDPQIRILQILH